MPPDEGTDAQQADPANPDTGKVEAEVTQTTGKDGDAADVSSAAQATDFLADLDEDTRDWLGKKNVKTPAEAARLAREQSKLLGNAIRVPGKDASEEERIEYLNKLGRPEDKDGYEFSVPDSLPEDVPYDADKAGRFRELAHSVGLTQAQAAAIHDWAAKETLDDVEAATEASAAQTAVRAAEETQKLEKLWGPLSGETAKANLAFANRFFETVGGGPVMAELKRLGLMGPNKEVLSEPIAVMAAKAGAALFEEDGVLRGNNAALDNPYADGATWNVTKQMKIAKDDRETALSLIAAAGKKPEDFGLKTRT